MARDRQGPAPRDTTDNYNNTSKHAVLPNYTKRRMTAEEITRDIVRGYERQRKQSRKAEKISAYMVERRNAGRRDGRIPDPNEMRPRVPD